jgi:diguanylate cyclase (GGDEF)-like protein
MAKNGSVLKVLVCDDDPQDIKLICHYLNQIHGRERVIFEAKQTSEIQDALEKGRIDLVLMDLQLPGKSGMQWLSEIVENRLAPVIILTGHGSEEIVVESLHKGAVGYLSKANLTVERLTQAINTAQGKWGEYLLLRGDPKELDSLINQDPLTGVLNRRAIMKKLDDIIKQARRYSKNYAVIMIDIDRFKHVNDNYGHLIGDDVLEKVSKLLRQRLRETDYIGRYGGDEFIIILSEVDLDKALVLASRMREAIMKSSMKDTKNNSIDVTISLGLTLYAYGDSERSIIERSDKALSIAKTEGRNRIRIDEVVTSHV